MAPPPGPFRRLIPSLAALTVVGVLYCLSRQPTLSDQEAAELAGRYQFQKLSIPELEGYPFKSERPIHPSLRHLSAWISAIGAAVALADLDGDGLPNDLLHVDPRVDQVVVTCAPGRTPRYPLFTLHPAPLAYDSATMAPTGCLVGDFNEDGSADVLVHYWGRSPVLFLRRAGVGTLGPGSFHAVDLVTPHQRWYTCAVTQADLDGDGHLDLIVGNYYPDGARILDANGTGSEPMPDSFGTAFNGGGVQFFLGGHANGDMPGLSVPFRRIEGVLEGPAARGWAFAIGAADLDGDLLPEVYLVNDFGPDRLLHNRSQPGKLRFGLLHGERTFTTPRSSVLGRDTFNGMGIDFGDLNGDGVPDMFVSNITVNFGFDETSFAFLSRKDQLHRMRDGVAPYRNASEDLGLSRGGWNWEARLADFDNDGVLEVMQAAGCTKGTHNSWALMHETALMNDQLTSNPRFWHRWQAPDDIAGKDHNPFYVRARDGRYYDLAHKIGLATPMNSRGIAVADIDGDGKLDFAVANQWEPSFLFLNESPGGAAFLGLNLRLPVGSGKFPDFAVHPDRPKLAQSTRPTVGATARVHLPDGRVLIGEVDGGTGHSGKRSPELHFGLGELDKTTKLRVELRWRDSGGEVREQTIELTPGWHTVTLGAKAGGQP